jgi:hypothetical protein
MSYQVELVESCRHSVRAIHLATGTKALVLWEKRSGGFRNFVAAQQKLASRVDKRRIIVFNDGDDQIVLGQRDGKPVLTDLATRLCTEQMNKPERRGLGFDLRLLWLSEIKSPERELPPNLLIVDELETVIIDVSGSGYFDGHASTSIPQVREWIREFDRLWGEARPAADFFPLSVATTSGPGGSGSVGPADDSSECGRALIGTEGDGRVGFEVARGARGNSDLSLSEGRSDEDYRSEPGHSHDPMTSEAHNDAADGPDSELLRQVRRPNEDDSHGQSPQPKDG